MARRPSTASTSTTTWTRTAGPGFEVWKGTAEGNEFHVTFSSRERTYAPTYENAPATAITTDNHVVVMTAYGEFVGTMWAYSFEEAQTRAARLIAEWRERIEESERVALNAERVARLTYALTGEEVEQS